jgi:predicted PurR-regulated permease PerM
VRGSLAHYFFAAAFSLVIAVVILIPLFFVGAQIAKQLLELWHYVIDVFRQNPLFLQEMFDKVAEFLNNLTFDQLNIMPLDIQNKALSMLNTGMQYALSFSRDMTMGIGQFIIGFVFTIFSLFFFFLDGSQLASLFTGIIPIRKDYISALVTKFKSIAKNLVLGYIMVALLQTVLAYIIFMLFSVKGALVFAALTFVCVFIPMFGGAIVWLPLGVVRIISGDITGGILFLIVSGICISLLDNVFRPIFLQDRIQLHPLIIFFSIIGGITAFGFNGIILGPMVVILFLTVLDLFLNEQEIEHADIHAKWGKP